MTPTKRPEPDAVLGRAPAVATVASLVLHGAFALAVTSLPEGALSGLAPGSTIVEFTTEPAPRPTPTIVPEPLPEPALPRPTAVARPTSTPEPTPAGAGALVPAIDDAAGTLEPGGPLVAVPSTAAPSDIARSAAEQQRLGVLVAPRSVASSWVVHQDTTGPSQPSGPAGVSATGGMPSVRSAAEVSASLGGGLRREAMARPWLSHTTPTLVQRPDGSQEYRGHAFTARILPDGSVRFSDRGAIEGHEMLAGGPARFDLTDAIMGSAGQDPYRAEREWFMEETEELRAGLEQTARARESAEALRGVPGRLATIWARPLPASVRRRQIFRMWDECEEEGDGARVRQQVVDYVRAELPASSADAFTVDELRRWNAERESEGEFRPYG